MGRSVETAQRYKKDSVLILLTKKMENKKKTQAVLGRDIFKSCLKYEAMSYYSPEALAF